MILSTLCIFCSFDITVTDIIALFDYACQMSTILDLFREK